MRLYEKVPGWLHFPAKPTSSKNESVVRAAAVIFGNIMSTPSVAATLIKSDVEQLRIWHSIRDAVLLAFNADLSLKHPPEPAQVWRGPRPLPPATMAMTNEPMISLVKYSTNATSLATLQIQSCRHKHNTKLGTTSALLARVDAGVVRGAEKPASRLSRVLESTSPQPGHMALTEFTISTV